MELYPRKSARIFAHLPREQSRKDTRVYADLAGQPPRKGAELCSRVWEDLSKTPQESGVCTVIPSQGGERNIPLEEIRYHPGAVSRAARRTERTLRNLSSPSWAEGTSRRSQSYDRRNTRTSVYRVQYLPGSYAGELRSITRND